jgi:hypothetical protein
MPVRIKVKDFRCFHETQQVEFKPINLLVGENSAGKTSFLAAARFSLDLLRRRTEASFNRDPFFLGSFDQIAHFRGGSFGRAKSFSFELTDSFPKLGRPKDQDELFPDAQLDSKSHQYTLRVHFSNSNSQPTISEIDFAFDNFRAQLVSGSDPRLLLQTPSREEFTITKRSLLRWRDTSGFDLSFFEFLLRDLPYLAFKGESFEENSSDPKNRRFLSELRFLSDVFRRITIRSSRGVVYASAPVRTKPERNYNLADFQLAADGGHIPFVLAQLFSFEEKRWNEIAESLAVFGKSSGLFDKLEIKQIGAVGTGPFQLIVHFPRKRSNIVDVGYGVSQALPIIADTLRMDSTTFLIQQPEVHLHPRAQAELGTFFSQVVKQKRHTLFIETHSDYLLDRIRMEVRRAKYVDHNDVAILFFERAGHDVLIHSLSIDAKGNIVGAPESYRKFFLHEEARSMGLESL